MLLPSFSPEDQLILVSTEIAISLWVSLISLLVEARKSSNSCLPRLSLASCIQVTDSITCTQLFYEEQKAPSSSSSSFRQVKERFSPVCCTYCCVFLRDAPFILDKAAIGSAAKSWYFFFTYFIIFQVGQKSSAPRDYQSGQNGPVIMQHLLEGT